MLGGEMQDLRWMDDCFTRSHHDSNQQTDEIYVVGVFESLY